MFWGVDDWYLQGFYTWYHHQDHSEGNYQSTIDLNVSWEDEI